jgi:hypothetical protein
MGLVSPTRATTSQTEGTGQQTEANALTTLLNEFNGNITGPNISAAAALTIASLTVGTTPFTDLSNAYKTVKTFGANATNAVITGAATYVLAGDGPTTFILAVSSGAAATVYFDPADYAITGRTTKYRLRVTYVTNGTQSGQTATVGLYPVSSVSGAGATLGVVTAGSTVAFANPAINTLSQGNSGDFTAPAAGYFAIGVATSGAFAASSQASVTVQLQVRQV